MVKSTIRDLINLIDDTIEQDGHQIVFADRVIGRVKYCSEKEIEDWLCSLGQFSINKVQELSIQYALLKRESNLAGIDYTIEDEIRCLVWGETDNCEKVVFKSFNPDIFSEYIIDPSISETLHESIRNELISLGVNRCTIK